MDSVAPVLDAVGSYAKEVPNGMWYMLGSVVLVAGFAAVVAVMSAFLIVFVVFSSVRRRLREGERRTNKYTELEVVASGAPFDIHDNRSDTDYDDATPLGAHEP